MSTGEWLLEKYGPTMTLEESAHEIDKSVSRLRQIASEEGKLPFPAKQLKRGGQWIVSSVKLGDWIESDNVEVDRTAKPNPKAESKKPTRGRPSLWALQQFIADIERVLSSMEEKALSEGQFPSKGGII